MKLRRLLQISKRHFSKSSEFISQNQTQHTPTETMFPQMILELEPQPLIKYFQTSSSAFTPESWVFMLERALMMPRRVQTILPDLLSELGKKLEFFEPVFIAFVMDILGQRNLKMPDFVEPLMASRSDFFEVQFKDETYVWMLENVKSSSNMQMIQSDFLSRYRLYNPPENEENFLTAEDAQKKYVPRFSLIIRLLRIFTIKKHSLMMIDLLEFRLLSETENLDLTNIIDVLSLMQQNKSRVPNQFLLEAISNRLLIIVRKVKYAEAVKLVEVCSHLDLKNTQVLNDISTVIENHISLQEIWTEEELEKIANSIFAFAKLEALSDSLYQAFQSLGFKNFGILNGKTISLLCFAHVKMIEKKNQFFQSKK